MRQNRGSVLFIAAVSITMSETPSVVSELSQAAALARHSRDFVSVSRRRRDLSRFPNGGAVLCVSRLRFRDLSDKT